MPRTPSNATASRRSSLSRKLATVFDPRPSVAPCLGDFQIQSPTPPLDHPPTKSSTDFATVSRRPSETSTTHSCENSVSAGNSTGTSAANIPTMENTHIFNQSTRTKSSREMPSSASTRTLSSTGVRAPARTLVKPAPAPSTALGREQPSPAVRSKADPMNEEARLIASFPAWPSPKRPPRSGELSASYDRSSNAAKINSKLPASRVSKRYSSVGKASSATKKVSASVGSTNQKDLSKSAIMKTRSCNVSQKGSHSTDTPSIMKLIPPRSSSQAALPPVKATVVVRKLSSTNRTAISKPDEPDPSTRNGTMPCQRLPRPSSSLGINRLEHEAPLMKELGHAQLQNLDDSEFLQILEDARRRHQKRVAQQADEANRIARMMQLGIISDKRIHKIPDLISPRDYSTRDSIERDAGVIMRGRSSFKAEPEKLRRRPSSAHGRLSRNNADDGEWLTNAEASGQIVDPNGTLTSSRVDVMPSDSLLMPLNTGNAIGHTLWSPAFSSDDDWKKEVRALFVIRELLMTEHSYARHLASMLQAVRKKAIVPSSGKGGLASSGCSPRRKSVSTLASVATGANVGSNNKLSERHLPLMRNLLPQLIALSHSLTSRIDANPTAEGVGSAFNVVAPQLEATFVAWSSVANEIMSSLRQTQGPKGKAKDKLVLVDVASSNESSEHSKWKKNGTAFASQPASPVKSTHNPSSDALTLTRPSSLIALASSNAEKRPEPQSPNSNAPSLSIEKETSKRRSTISSVHPRNFRGLSAERRSEEPSKGPTDVAALPTMPSRPSSPWGFVSRRRSLAAVASKRLSLSTLGLDFQNAAVAGNRDGPSSSLARSAGAIGNGDGSVSATNGRSKALSVLDVAIMPMQRPPRYLLLLTELLRATPPSSVSRVRVTRSLELMKAIAQKCDEASSNGAIVGVVKASSANLPASSGSANELQAGSSRSTTPLLPSRASTMLAMTAAR